MIKSWHFDKTHAIKRKKVGRNTTDISVTPGPINV